MTENSFENMKSFSDTRTIEGTFGNITFIIVLMKFKFKKIFLRLATINNKLTALRHILVNKVTIFTDP